MKAKDFFIYLNIIRNCCLDLITHIDNRRMKNNNQIKDFYEIEIGR